MESADVGENTEAGKSSPELFLLHVTRCTCKSRQPVAPMGTFDFYYASPGYYYIHGVCCFSKIDGMYVRIGTSKSVDDES